ncbi:MAG: PEP-CTERM sorting domain-containing protein [Sedimentisphaerales bacterium]|nr:PEP-CTERM sorting domain-containing protein [Sedimentisphaerales bacterium]
MAHADDVTFNDRALMALDFHSAEGFTPQVTAKWDIAEPGVQFDIRFPGKSGLDSQMLYASSLFGGAGSLVPIDISSYDNFQLNFTYDSITDVDPEDAENMQLWVSPFVNDGEHWKYFSPELIGIAPGQENSILASMDISQLAGMSQPGDNILEIGFEIHMDYPDAWDISGNTVSLIIAPAEGAVPVPEPTALTILALGGLSLLRRQKTSTEVCISKLPE